MRLRLFSSDSSPRSPSPRRRRPLASSGRNPQVAGLQVALRAQGPLPRPDRRGLGAAARSRPCAASSGSTGCASPGSPTRARARALGPLGRPLFGARTLHRGNFGWDVAVLQFLLVRQGISVPVNAYFDGPTLRGVRLLQQRLHLRRDGVVGPHTLQRHRRGTSRCRSRTRRHGRRRRTVARRTRISLRGSTSCARATRSRRSRAATAPRSRSSRTSTISIPRTCLLIGTKLRFRRAASRPPQVTRRSPSPTARMSIASVRSLLDRWAAHYGVDRASRARARVDGVRLQQPCSSPRSGRAGSCSSCRTTWRLRRDRADRPPRARTTPTATSTSASPISTTFSTTSTATSGSRSRAGTRASAP